MCLVSTLLLILHFDFFRKQYVDYLCLQFESPKLLNCNGSNFNSRYFSGLRWLIGFVRTPN
jgi:hypothetical protein